MRWTIVLFCMGLAGCDVPVATPIASGAQQTQPAQRSTAQRSTAQTFAAVVLAVEPVAERECRLRTSKLNCDFLIVIDPNRKARPRAHLKLDKTRRPVITFSLALINQTRNPDELAFVLGHEAGHHISRHIYRQSGNAMAGAAIFGELSALNGGTTSEIKKAKKRGAFAGSRSYSKDFELEADELGTIIAHRAGFNPLIGARFFELTPDPGDRFMGTHPPNAARLKVVQRTSARLGVRGS